MRTFSVTVQLHHCTTVLRGRTFICLRNPCNYLAWKARHYLYCFTFSFATA